MGRCGRLKLVKHGPQKGHGPPEGGSKKKTKPPEGGSKKRIGPPKGGP